MASIFSMRRPAYLREHRGHRGDTEITEKCEFLKNKMHSLCVLCIFSVCSVVHFFRPSCQFHPTYTPPIHRAAPAALGTAGSSTFPAASPARRPSVDNQTLQ